MASPITKIEADKLAPTLRRLGDAGATTAHADWIRAPRNAEWLVETMDQRIKRMSAVSQGENPFKMEVGEQIAALRSANKEEGWSIAEEVFARLESTVPAWPEGRDSYRSFRIRFGEAAAGVRQTFLSHIGRINHVHAHKFGVTHQLDLDRTNLALEAGNVTHRSVVEWTIVHLDAHRELNYIGNVRTPLSLADEGLVMAWLFPARAEAIEVHGSWCGWLCAGYTASVTEGRKTYYNVPQLRRDSSHGTGTSYLYLNAQSLEYQHHESSVPFCEG